VADLVLAFTVGTIFEAFDGDAFLGHFLHDSFVHATALVLDDRQPRDDEPYWVALYGHRVSRFAVI